MALRPHEQRSRRALDYTSVRAICGEFIAMSAFRSIEDRTPITVDEGKSGHARVFLIEYRFPTLEPGGRLRSGACIRFDLTHPEYPFRPPNVQAAGPFIPWLPHIHDASGMVCIGSSWQDRRGKYTLADLVLHTARLLNADEPGGPRDAYDAETVEFLDQNYGGGPINRGLVLPAVPPEIVAGTIEVPAGSFGIVRSAAAPPQGGFRIAPRVEGTFRRVRPESAR